MAKFIATIFRGLIGFADILLPKPTLVHASTVTIAEFDGTTDSGNIQNPLRGSASANLEANGISLGTSDTLDLDVSFNDDIELIVQAGAGTSAFSISAGVNPPSPHAAKGAAAFSIPNGETWRIIPQAGRHINASGKIAATVATTACTVWAFRLPAGFVGMGYTNRTTIPAKPTA